MLFDFEEFTAIPTTCEPSHTYSPYPQANRLRALILGHTLPLTPGRGHFRTQTQAGHSRTHTHTSQDTRSHLPQAENISGHKPQEGHSRTHTHISGHTFTFQDTHSHLRTRSHLPQEEFSFRGDPSVPPLQTGG